MRLRLGLVTVWHMYIATGKARGFLQGLVLLAACFLCVSAAWAAEIRGVSIHSGATGTRAEVQLDRSAAFNVISLANPHRLVVDFPQSSLAANTRLPAGAGLVRGVRNGQPVPGTARLVFDLTQAVVASSTRIESTANGAMLVIEWPGDAPVNIAAATPVAAPPPVASTPTVAAVVQAAANRPQAILDGQTASHNPAPPAAAIVQPPAPAPATTAAAVAAEPAAQPALRLRATGMRPLIVAIDAGHGGQDPGAVGLNGLREKDVTLRIARELARQVDATPGLQAYLVRNSDEFVPLAQRAQRARRAKADIFISIHADAAENRNARGGSVYVLSLRGASSQRARWLAQKENASDLIGGRAPIATDETLNSVLLDLTQSGNMRASEDAAGHVLNSMAGVGSIRRVERANFAVLRTADMPAMLVETAFISNPEEERMLADPSFQRRMAGAILQGVHAYFSAQPPPGTMYAARAEAASGAGGAR